MRQLLRSILICTLIPRNQSFVPSFSQIETLQPSTSLAHQNILPRATIAPGTASRTSYLPSSKKDEASTMVDSPRTLVRKGMQSFRGGDIPLSLSYFDRADAAVADGSLRPYLWQRGISYYYLDRFKEGSDQFRLDVSVNPLDVEEIVWDIACLARINPDDFPPSKRMSLPKGKSDRRRIMSTVYSLFRGDGATEHDLADAGHNGNISDEFYSLFYLGLYCEIRNEMSKAESYMKAAAASPYAVGPGQSDYMTSCARVHCALRGWV